LPKECVASEGGGCAEYSYGCRGTEQRATTKQKKCFQATETLRELALLERAYIRDDKVLVKEAIHESTMLVASLAVKHRGREARMQGFSEVS
jgi:hypothetical protein